MAEAVGDQQAMWQQEREQQDCSPPDIPSWAFYLHHPQSRERSHGEAVREFHPFLSSWEYVRATRQTVVTDAPGL